MSKIQLEKIEFEHGKSFKLFSPRLRNYFYWHYHPEYELVFVEGDSGIRHVGSHVSTYSESDLVFIGPNIPHLNFDYRLKKEYHQIVVQTRENFLGNALNITPEFGTVRHLFDKAAFGLAFHGSTKSRVAEKLKRLGRQGPFRQMLDLLDIFQDLAVSEEVTILNERDMGLKRIVKDKIRMGEIYEYIHEYYNQKPNVHQVAERVHLTTSAFCRYFKKLTQMTFTDFVNLYRMDMAKTLLLQNRTVTETCFEVGYESLSYFNKVFKNTVGINPSEFKKRNKIT